MARLYVLSKFTRGLHRHLGPDEGLPDPAGSGADDSDDAGAGGGANLVTATVKTPTPTPTPTSNPGPTTAHPKCLVTVASAQWSHHVL